MKKNHTTHEYKIRNTKRAKTRLKSHQLSQAKRKTKRRKLEWAKLNARRLEEFINTIEIVKTPSNFSFIHNTEAVLYFLDRLSKLFRQRKFIRIDLTNITNLTNDAIVLLLAYIKNPQINNGASISGTYPKDEKLRKIFIESGVFASNLREDKRRNYILTRKNKKAEGKVAAELIKRASKVIFGEEGRCPGIYRALMECMANTCYHAQPQQLGEETWWLTVYHDQEKNHVSFAFVDLGVGIFKSSNVTGFRESLSMLFGIKDNCDVLKEILSGNKLSSTNIHYRGKGLPTIFKGLERNYYSNLKIISNDVKADLSREKFEILNHEFKGTFLYFELNDSNRWIK